MFLPARRQFESRPAEVKVKTEVNATELHLQVEKKTCGKESKLEVYVRVQKGEWSECNHQGVQIDTYLHDVIVHDCVYYIEIAKTCETITNTSDRVAQRATRGES